MSTILTDAADLIERDGWCQRTMTDGRGRRCIASAIYDVAGWSNDSVAAVRAMGFASASAAVAWNDDPVRTVADVLARLRSVEL